MFYPFSSVVESAVNIMANGFRPLRRPLNSNHVILSNFLKFFLFVELQDKYLFECSY